MKKHRIYILVVLAGLVFLGSCKVYAEAEVGPKAKPKLCNVPSEKHFNLKGAGL